MSTWSQRARNRLTGVCLGSWVVFKLPSRSRPCIELSISLIFSLIASRCAWQSSPRDNTGMTLSLRIELAAAGGGGCLAERKRRTPKERRETAKRFKVPDRLREARRAAAVERGNPPPSAAIGAAYYPLMRDRIFSVWNQRAENAIPNRPINPLFR